MSRVLTCRDRCAIVSWCIPTLARPKSASHLRSSPEKRNPRGSLGDALRQAITIDEATYYWAVAL